MSKNWEVKKANIELHRKTAKFFEEENLELFNMFEQRYLEERLRKVNQTCKRHTICCDLACGTGNLTKKQIFEFSNVIGLDISRDMIKIRKAEGIGDMTHFLVGDAENLPFRDNIFDMVTIHAALHHLPSPSNCFKEIYRILDTEGILYVDHEPNSKNLRFALEKIKKILDIIGNVRARKRKTYQSTGNLLFPAEYRIADIYVEEGFHPGEIRKKLQTIGFSSVKISYHNTFSSYFFRLPFPLNMLSTIDKILDHLPLIKHLSSHICIWAKK